MPVIEAFLEVEQEEESLYHVAVKPTPPSYWLYPQEDPLQLVDLKAAAKRGRSYPK